MRERGITVDFDAKQIDPIFAQLDQCHLPGAAVGIAVGGKPVYRKGFGVANMELPLCLAPTTRFRIASVTKHFAAFAYMLLCERGQAGIDDPLGKHFPELHPVTHAATMRQLMSNTSGLRDAIDIKFQFSGMHGPYVSSAELLALYRDMDDVNAAPGTAWIYNNGGWVLLSAAIERISGQSFGQFLREHVFEPVGMHDTLVRQEELDFLPHSAAGHVAGAGGAYARAYLGVDYAGAGAMISTVDDMLRWLAHMDAPKVGSAATWALMKAPQRLANGTCSGYGLGLMTARYRGVVTLAHAGNWQGFNSQMLKVPAAGLDIVILVNRSDVSSVALGAKVIDACITGLDEASSTATPFATGTFRSSTTGRVVQLFAREEQQFAAVDGMDIPLEADSGGVLWAAGLCSFMKLGITHLGNPAAPTSIRVGDFGNADELVAVAPAAGADAREIVGRYRSSTTGTDATIAETDRGPRLQVNGRFGSVAYELERLGDRIWRTRPASLPFLGGILSFDDDHGAFRFSAALTRALPFRRCV